MPFFSMRRFEREGRIKGVRFPPCASFVHIFSERRFLFFFFFFCVDANASLHFFFFLFADTDWCTTLRSNLSLSLSLSLSLCSTHGERERERERERDKRRKSHLKQRKMMTTPFARREGRKRLLELANFCWTTQNVLLQKNVDATRRLNTLYYVFVRGEGATFGGGSKRTVSNGGRGGTATSFATERELALFRRSRSATPKKREIFQKGEGGTKRRGFASDAAAARKEEFRLLPRICSVADLKLNELAFFKNTIPFLRCTSSSSRNGMTITELCGHSAFVLLGWSYVVDDPFLLRCLATASFSAQICFQFFREKPLWLPIRWNVLFVGVNMVWIAKMLNEYSEKSLKDLTNGEREVYDAFFKVKEKEVMTMSSSEVEEETNSKGEKVVSAAPKKTTKTYRTHQIHPSDFKELMKLGEWKELKEGEVIAVKGKVNKYIYAIVDGAAELSLDDVVPSVTVVAASAREKMAAMTKTSASASARNLPSNKNILRRGKFVGEMALSHGAAFGTVVVGKEGAKVLVWDTNKLRDFVAENPRAMNSVQASFGRSLVEKMKIVGME